jgi:hypothetical protein
MLQVCVWHDLYNIVLTFRNNLYRVIHKSLQDFWPLRYRSWDGHAEGEHVNRGRDTPSFCPTLQVLDMSNLGDAADVNPVIKFLPHTLQHRGPPMPRDLPQLRWRIMEAVTAIDRQMLQCVWQGTEIWSVSASVDMLLFGLTVPASVPQASEIPEGLTNYLVYSLRARPLHRHILGAHLICNLTKNLWKVQQNNSVAILCEVEGTLWMARRWYVAWEGTDHNICCCIAMSGSTRISIRGIAWEMIHSYEWIKVQWQALHRHEYRKTADHWPSRIEKQGRFVQKYVSNFLHISLCLAFMWPCIMINSYNKTN